MSTLPQTFVAVTPRELKFENVKLNQTFVQTVNFENTLSYPVNIEIKAGNAFRYKINEPTITLQSNESKNIEIQLKLTKSISTKSLNIKDIFYIKSDFFNDHISSIITMAATQQNDINENENANVNANDNIYHNYNDNNITSEIFEDREIEKENKNLRDYIIKLENNMSELKIELSYFGSVKSEINASIPDLEAIVDATIGKERAANEVRNKKVLQILQSKDEEIQKLKEINKNYQSVQTSLHFLQTKHANLTQIFQDAQNENNALKQMSNQYQQQIDKLNEKISSYSQQSEFQKKIVNERDLRIKELTKDIKETQNMLANNTNTMKMSYNQQIKQSQNKLNESNNTIQRMTDELNEKDIESKKESLSSHKIMEENRILNEYKTKHQQTFNTELQQIKKDIFPYSDNEQEQINNLQIELAKLRSFIRLGFFKNNENIIDYQQGKNINKQMVNELARKSAHLSASKAIIQQQRDRISELENLQKLTNKSVFEQSVQLNESNKKLTNNSSENQRLLSIYKRQIEILNKKLSNSIHNEEQINIKWQNLKRQLSVSGTDYVDKIEELEEALIAVNNINAKTKKQPSKSAKNRQIVQLENKLIKTENELQSIAKTLKSEMRQRQCDLKTHHIKLQNGKQLYEKQINRMQSIIHEIQSNNKNKPNLNRVIALNNELAQSEELKNEYLNEIQILKNSLKETHQNGSCHHGNNQNNAERDKLLLALNEKCSKQKEEICDLEDIMNAAVTELKKYNPDIIHKLKARASHTLPCEDDQITKIKQICDVEINRYRILYENMDKEYQSYKKKINLDIQQKDECYLNELAQQKQQITKFQSEIAQFRKLNLNQQQQCQTLQIENQSLATKLEQYTELEMQTTSHIPHASNSGDTLSEHEAIPILKLKSNDIVEMEEIITHQDAQIKVLMNTIETLQHHKPKKSQIVQLTGRLAVHETLQCKRKKELQSIRSNWLQDQERRVILDKKCASLEAKVKSLKFELKNSKLHNESVCNQFENHQRQIIDKENKIHELELGQSRLQSIRKQLESRANIMQNEMDTLSKQHFQHLQTLSNEHQNQLKKISNSQCNNLSQVDNDKNNECAVNHSLQSNVSNDFHDSLKCLSHLLEKYLIQQQQTTNQQKKKMGSLMKSFNSNILGGVNITSIEDKHQFMRQLMNIVSQQYGNIISLQKQTNFYEWLSRHHYNKRKESETNELSLQCQLQINKKHLKRVKGDIEHNQLIIQQQLQKRKDLIKQQMNKAIHRYLALETECNKLTAQFKGCKKQCAHFESQYFFVLNQLNLKKIDISEKEMKLKQDICEELSMNANERDAKLKEYLHDNLKNVIQETIRKFEKNDLYENQIFELSNEMLSLKYVQNELTKQLEKALFDNQMDKNENKRLCQMIRNSNEFYEKMRKHQQIIENEHKCKPELSENSSTTQSPIKYNKNHSLHDIKSMELEHEICDKQLENESLQSSINGLQKEIEELLEQININEIKHENELKNMRQQIGKEREILIQNHNSEIANNQQQHQHKIQQIQIEMEQVCQKVRPWTDSLDLNQLKQTVEAQTQEISRSNIHLQTLRTKVTQLEYELSDNEKEMESHKFVIEHLQDTIKLFSMNNDETSQTPSTKLIVATLCKELTKSRRAQSNAMIKLRVSSQSEIELQETISSREKRINELKQYLNMKKAANIKGQVIDITKNDRKIDELILQIASKDAEIRYLKKKLSIEQTKITVVYDIKPLQELVDKIDIYYHNAFGTKVPYKPQKVQIITDNASGLQNEINNLKQENKKLREYEMTDMSSDNNKKQRDRLEMAQSKKKLHYLVRELNEYINKIKSVCNVSFGKSSQRSTLKLKKIEDLCKLQHIKIGACSDQINHLLMNVIQNIDIFDGEYQGLQVAHQRLQQHIADEKTKYVEIEQELLSIRTTLNTYKFAEKRRRNVQDHCIQTDTIDIDFDAQIKIKSLQHTITSLQKSQNLETQDWRDDIVSLHEQLLQSKIDIKRYKKECKELQNMYLELKAQLKPSKNKLESAASSGIISNHHQLRLAAIERKRKISSLQRQLHEANGKWKQSEIKYQKLLSDNIHLQKKSESLSVTVNELNTNKEETVSEMNSICHNLQSMQCEYEKQSKQFMKLKEKNTKLRHKNEELNKKTLSTERRSDKETDKLREQLISAQCENKKERELMKALQDKISEYETDLCQIKCDKEADIELKKQSHKSKVRHLHDKYDKNISDKNQQIKELERLYEEEQKHHTQHFNKLMRKFDEYKDTQSRIQKMYEMQLNLLKKRFENAIIAEQERLTECQSVKSMKSSNTNTNNSRAHSLRKSQSISRICVYDYSDLLYDLSQRDAALKSVKNELKSLKLTVKRKERERQKLLNKDKRPNASNENNKNQTNSLFEVRASAVWSARLTHCTIQITEFKKKLAFEQEIGIQKDEDIENYQFEMKRLKLQILNLHKKLESQINIKSKKCIHFESEITNWKIKEKEWEQEKEKLNQDIIQFKKSKKKAREDTNRKEYILQQFKQENETNKNKLEAIKLKRKSTGFYNSDKYKELNKEMEAMKNKLQIKENLLSDLKRKYQKCQNNFDKIQLNNHELQSKHRSVNSEISRKEILINELKNKLQNTERENISNKADIELISKLKQKCKQLKSNENRKDELWRSNKQRLEIVTKELNLFKLQNSQKHSKMVSKLNKIQNDEECISKKYCKIKNESIEFKTIIDSLYNKLSSINNDLLSTLNDIQTNYYKKNKNKNNRMQYDDTLKAAQIVDGFTVNELEEIMHCKGKKKECYGIANDSYSPKTILWDKYGEKIFVLQLFEKIIDERIRLEMMICKLKMHQNGAANSDNLENDQFEKIKIKHQQHINEYQAMLNKFRKHK